MQHSPLYCLQCKNRGEFVGYKKRENLPNPISRHQHQVLTAKPSLDLQRFYCWCSYGDLLREFYKSSKD